MVSARDVVLLSTADWDNPFWTNKQHVAVELARRGFRVLYVESLGLRQPTLKARDLRRIARRLLRSVRPPRQVRNNLWVWSPLVVPAHGRPWARRLNRLLLRAGIAICARRLKLRSDILWTYNPLAAEVLRLSSFRLVVYHCVDDVKAAPGMPVQAISNAESALVAHADVVFTTAPKLAEIHSKRNSHTHYLPNVADFDHFSRARSPTTRIPNDLIRIPEPRIGFVGAISRYKLDFHLLRAIAQSHPNWSVVLIGEIGEGDPWTDVSSLSDLPNLYFLGPRPYSELPAYLKGLDVGILPSAMNEYTASMFPMKFFEYLAAGLPVVSVNLPALRDHADVATLANTPEAFIDAIDRELATPDSSLDIRLVRAQQHTYVSRMEVMLEILDRTERGRTSHTRPPASSDQRARCE